MYSKKSNLYNKKITYIAGAYLLVLLNSSPVNAVFEEELRNEINKSGISLQKKAIEDEKSGDLLQKVHKIGKMGRWLGDQIRQNNVNLKFTTNYGLGFDLPLQAVGNLLRGVFAPIAGGETQTSERDILKFWIGKRAPKKISPQEACQSTACALYLSAVERHEDVGSIYTKFVKEWNNSTQISLIHTKEIDISLEDAKSHFTYGLAKGMIMELGEEKIDEKNLATIVNAFKSAAEAAGQKEDGKDYEAILKDTVKKQVLEKERTDKTKKRKTEHTQDQKDKSSKKSKKEDGPESDNESSGGKKEITEEVKR